jgi:hypothetical protein
MHVNDVAVMGKIVATHLKISDKMKKCYHQYLPAQQELISGKI